VTDPTPSGARAAEAFAPTADPAAYVPRLALEAALAELAEVIGKTPACAALSGEPGLGKTLLLLVLRERLLGAFECLYVPFPRLSAPELWRWAAAALGLGAGEDDRDAVLGRARRLAGEGSGLVLLLDDAGALPVSTRADLFEALDTPGFSLVLALGSDDILQLDSLPPYVRRVEIGPPMTRAETRSYVHARLRHADPEGALAARLTADRLAALHEASGGVPARLHGLLDAWLRSTADVGSPSAGEGRAVAPAAPVAPPLRLPAPLRALSRELARPALRLTLLGLVLAATLGAWLLAWQQGPGVASVGIPVEPAPPRTGPETPPLASEDRSPNVAAEPPAEELAPANPEPEPAPAPEAPQTAPTSTAPEGATPEALASRKRRVASLAPALPAAPPAPDPRRVELPVHIASPRFPDEHVPRLLEPEPLAAAPAGPRLSVNARPWAAIRLDGTPVGETPLGELRVEPGSHVVSAHLPDGRVVERTVEARAGDVYVVFP